MNHAMYSEFDELTPADMKCARRMAVILIGGYLSFTLHLARYTEYSVVLSVAVMFYMIYCGMSLIKDCQDQKKSIIKRLIEYKNKCNAKIEKDAIIVCEVSCKLKEFIKNFPDNDTILGDAMMMTANDLLHKFHAETVISKNNNIVLIFDGRVQLYKGNTQKISSIVASYTTSNFIKNIESILYSLPDYSKSEYMKVIKQMLVEPEFTFSCITFNLPTGCELVNYVYHKTCLETCGEKYKFQDSNIFLKEHISDSKVPDMGYTTVAHECVGKDNFSNTEAFEEYLLLPLLHAEDFKDTRNVGLKLYENIVHHNIFMDAKTYLACIKCVSKNDDSSDDEDEDENNNECEEASTECKISESVGDAWDAKNHVSDEPKPEPEPETEQKTEPVPEYKNTPMQDKVRTPITAEKASKHYNLVIADIKKGFEKIQQKKKEKRDKENSLSVNPMKNSETDISENEPVMVEQTQQQSQQQSTTFLGRLFGY